MIGQAKAASDEGSREVGCVLRGGAVRMACYSFSIPATVATLPGGGRSYFRRAHVALPIRSA